MLDNHRQSVTVELLPTHDEKHQKQPTMGPHRRLDGLSSGLQGPNYHALLWYIYHSKLSWWFVPGSITLISRVGVGRPTIGLSFPQAFEDTVELSCDLQPSGITVFVSLDRFTVWKNRLDLPHFRLVEAT